MSTLKLDIRSFAFRDGIPGDVDFSEGVYLFDCRHLPDPYWEGDLRYQSGCDEDVKAFFAAHDEAVRPFLEPIEEMVRGLIVRAEDLEWERITILFGCVGGHHRSVYCAEQLAEHLRPLEDAEVTVTHMARADWNM